LRSRKRRTKRGVDYWGGKYTRGYDRAKNMDER